MPLSSDERINQLADEILKAISAVFGAHPGYRPAHPKGVMLKGAFSAAPEAAALTRAPHIARKTVPVVVRLSDGSGIPAIPDNNPDASPRGFAIRFYLAEHEHTDIVCHSTDG